MTWKTNRNIGRKDPLEYLADRVEWADEAVVRQRLRTHLLDFDQLSRATYVTDGKPLEGVALVEQLTKDFNGFLETRARLVEVAASRLAKGDLLSLEELHHDVELTQSKLMSETV